jgi:Lon protease-like protein
MLPLVPFGRVVLPGTRHSVPTERAGLTPGERVVVVLVQPGGALSRVGTASQIRGVGAEGEGRSVLDLVGEALVSIDAVGDPVPVTPIDTTTRATGKDPLPAVERALRGYMAARAEAGFGGDVHVAISRDPVIASHQVASLLEISWPEVQDILEAGDASERLEREFTVLTRETALLRAVLGRSD